jgi:Ni/Co efflux regulator RcnB
MKKTLLSLATALVLAGAMSSTASAQSAYNGYNDRDRDGVEDQYDRVDNRYDNVYQDPRYAGNGYQDPRYANNGYQDPRYAAYADDLDRDGVANRYDNDDDNDGISDRYDSNDGRVDRNDGRRYQDGRGYGYNDRDRDGVRDRYDRHDNGRHLGWHKAKHRYHAGRYASPRGYAYRQYQVGSRLPQGYYGSSYYVNHGNYGLTAPPRGYRWNRVGNAAYLVSTSNGVIRDVLYSLFY